MNNCPKGSLGQRVDGPAHDLSDVQGGGIQTYGHLQVGHLVKICNGADLELWNTFIESDTKKWVISEGELNLAGWRKVTEGDSGFLQHGQSGESIALKMIGRSWYMKARSLSAMIGSIEEEGPNELEAGQSTLDRFVRKVPVAEMTFPDIPREPVASRSEPSELGPSRGIEYVLVPEATEVLTIHSSVKAMKKRLAELRAPLYGTKNELIDRLGKYEILRERERLDYRWQLKRAQDIAAGELPREVTRKEVPETPTLAEVEQHSLTHLPAKRWCLVCLLAKSKDDPHPRALEIERGPPKAYGDFMSIKEDGEICEEDEKHEPLNPWATTLTLVDTPSGMGLALALPTKTATFSYTVRCIVSFIRKLAYIRLIFRIDGENALKALFQKAKGELLKYGIRVDLEVYPRYSPQSLNVIGPWQGFCFSAS